MSEMFGGIRQPDGYKDRNTTNQNMNSHILARSIRSLLVVPLLLGASVIAQDKKLPEIRVDEKALERDVHTSYAPVIERVSPSVVTIATQMRADKLNKSADRGADDRFFRRFFGLPDPGEDAPKAPKPESKNGKLVPAGLGSGVIVSADGYILTNHHVVNEADEIKVTLADGKTVHKAKKIASDEGSDIAVIKLEAGNLQPITFADSDKIKVGDVAIAIGSPFALRQTVTKGIISAIGRDGTGISEFGNFIQTDASINPGNSGGALIDAQGRLVGIPSAIYSRSGGNMGIGFAVPSNQARSVMESLLKFGRVQRGFLGIKMDEMDEALAKSLGLENTHGIVIADVVPGGAAEKAGLKAEDVIIELDGRKFTDLPGFKNSIAAKEPGAKADLKIIRDKKELNVSVTLGDRSGSVAVAAKPAPEAVKKDPDVLDGVQVADINAQQRQALRIDENVRGALVTAVPPGTPSADAELRAGDVIISINGKDVKDAEDAVKLSEDAKHLNSVRLRVHRAGQTRFVIVEAPKEN